jgi:hypothetical protein
MKKHYIFIVLLVLPLIIGCEEEDLSPRTNPRFSVAYVQEIDESGAEFASNIYDFGSEEITEYGFLYSLEFFPVMDNSEVITMQGKPEKLFTLKAQHSLIKGKIYYVVAFVQTTSGRVFSEPYRFSSQGAPGFVYERMDYKSPVFYGDTITVKGSNLSQLISSYSIEFQNKEARVISVEESSFKFIVPEFYDFNTSENGPDYFDVTIQVLDKKLEMNINIPFQNAEFQDMETQFIDYGDPIEIFGNYLKDPHLKIVTGTDVPESIYANNVTIETAEEDKVVFTPNPKYAGLHKYLTFEIRGKLYPLGTRVFGYNPTEIIPGQHLLIKPFEDFTIKGQNFNTKALNTHIAIVNGFPVTLEGSTTDSESLTFRIRINDLGTSFNRSNNELKIKTLGNYSKEAITFEFTNPDFPYLENSYAALRPSGYWALGNMVGFNEKGFALGNNEIFEFDVENKKVDFVHRLPIETSQLGFTFGVIQGENWYLGGGRIGDERKVNPSFFVFNLRTKQSRRLPDLPFYEMESKLVHAVNGYLYFEGGIVPETGNDHKKRYKFNLQTEKWTRLPDKEIGREVFGRTIAFGYNGNQLAIGDPDGSLNRRTGIFNFDPIKETWKLIKQIDGFGYAGVKTDQVFVIGNTAFLLGNRMHVLNLENYEIRSVTNFAFPDLLNHNFDRNMAFMSKDKIYILDVNSNLWEIDLEKLEY